MERASREPGIHLLIVNVGEDSEHKTKLSKIKYGDYPMKTWGFPCLKRLSCLFLCWFDPSKQKHSSHILRFIFLAGVVNFLKLIVGNELCFSLS